MEADTDSVCRLAPNGFEAWSEGSARESEGYVAKDETSPVRGRADAALAEGQAKGLDRRGRRLEAADQARVREPLASRARLFINTE